MILTIGTARAKPGRITYGTFDLVDHPTGGSDQLPVVIAQGDPAGPVFWLTAGIHGVEHAGVLVIHQLLTPALAKALHGTVVAIPVLNPAGLRTMRREAYYYEGDPNRLFPEGRKPPSQPDPDADPPSALEKAYGRLFDEIKATGHYMVDLHNAWTNSVSFVFRDRLFYRNDGPAAKRKAAKAAAEKLDRRMAEMCAAYGHSVVNEMPPAPYLEQRLHRSTTSAAANVAHIPAFTAELSTGHMPDPAVVVAAGTGMRNVFRWAQMLEGSMEPIAGIKVVKPGFPCRRRPTPRVNQACIVRHLVEPGDLVRKGDPIAELRDVWGRPVGDKVLRSDYDGWVIGRTQGIAYYPGTEVCAMAIRDDLPTVQPYPTNYWKK
jgi:predicted deacylase